MTERVHDGARSRPRAFMTERVQRRRGGSGSFGDAAEAGP
ncbi:hypothetical protein OJJOAM_001490 [Cupriavidus sp. H18C1]